MYTSFISERKKHLLNECHCSLIGRSSKTDRQIAEETSYTPDSVAKLKKKLRTKNCSDLEQEYIRISFPDDDAKQYSKAREHHICEEDHQRLLEICHENLMGRNNFTNKQIARLSGYANSQVTKMKNLLRENILSPDDQLYITQRFPDDDKSLYKEPRRVTQKTSPIEMESNDSANLKEVKNKADIIAAELEQALIANGKWHNTDYEDIDRLQAALLERMIPSLSSETINTVCNLLSQRISRHEELEHGENLGGSHSVYCTYYKKQEEYSSKSNTKNVEYSLQAPARTYQK